MKMTREDLHHLPKSGMIDLAIQKEREREALNADIEAYLARGGKITQVERGVIADICMITKKPFNPSIHNGKGIKRL